MRIEGVVARWFNDRGFGFVRPDGRDEDVFLHITAVTGELQQLMPGDRVSFELARNPGNDRIRAVQAILISA